jgi:hypothetical protein
MRRGWAAIADHLWSTMAHRRTFRTANDKRVCSANRSRCSHEPQHDAAASLLRHAIGMDERIPGKLPQDATQERIVAINVRRETQSPGMVQRSPGADRAPRPWPPLDENREAKIGHSLVTKDRG